MAKTKTTKAKFKAKSKAKQRRAQIELRRAHTKQRRAESEPLRAQTMPRQSPAAAVPPEADDDPVPKNIDEFRRALARRILTLVGMPRRCRAPGCRRARRCVGPDLRCQRDNPLPKLSPEREAAMKAALQRALRRRLAAGGQGREA
jgi:hypothetical protein